MKISLFLAICSLATIANCQAGASDREAINGRILQQLSSPGRDRYDAAKDPGRMPVEFMQFFGVESGMQALDLITGAGYNAEILSAAVGRDGLVYAQNSHYVVRLIGGAHHKAMIARTKDNRLTNVRYIVVATEHLPFDATMDIVFWGTNLHDVYNADGADGALVVLHQAMRALKPGGIFALSDHVGIAGQDNAALHRIEPDIMRDLLIQAGFKIEATSDLLANPNDDHKQSIYTDGLRYKTDRILIRARKPGAD